MRKFLKRWGYIVGPLVLIAVGLGIASTGFHLWGAAGALGVIIVIYGLIKFGPQVGPPNPKRK